MAKNKLDLKPLIKDFNRRRTQLPRKLGNGAVMFFRANFAREGFLDRTVSKWKKRKFPELVRGGQKKILKISGALLRSIKVISKNVRAIKIGTVGVAYAEIHNTGGTTRPKVTPRMRGWARHQFQKTGNPIFLAIANTKKKRLSIEIPKRQYIGKSAVLEKSLKKRIEKELSIFAQTQR